MGKKLSILKWFGAKFYMNEQMLVFVVLEHLKQYVHLPVNNDDELDYLVHEIIGKLDEKMKGKIFEEKSC